MLICSFCNKECKNDNSLKNHERRCPQNPERIYKNGMTGKKGRNGYMKAADLGLPKPIRSKESIQKGLDTRRKNGTLLHTEETKKCISKIRIEYLKNNPDKVPYILNHSSKTSFPELYFNECFQHLSNVTKEYHVHTYHLDFANVSKKLYLEIDGDQHYLDKKIVLHDEKRTEILSNLGWTGIRIKWSDFKKKSFQEKVDIIDNIILKMQWI